MCATNKEKISTRTRSSAKYWALVFRFHIIHLFVVDGRVHDDGVGGRRGSSERRSRRDTTAARGATNAAGRTTTTAATAVTITILVAGREEALHAAGRHRRSFSL